MALWGERQVKRDLGIVDHRRKHQTFDKLFQTPPYVEYTAREPRTAGRLRRLMGTNVVELTNFCYMDKLEHRTIRMYHEDLQARIDERAHQAAQLAHLQLWESVLRGQSTVPPEKLDDPCMRQVRQHQLKIQGLQQQAAKLGTSVLRVATMPHVWSEPSKYKPPKRKKGVPSPPADSNAGRPTRQGARLPLRGATRSSLRAVSSLYPQASPSAMAAEEQSVMAMGQANSWMSRRMVIKWSDDARAKRSRSAGCLPSGAFGHQYRRLTGDSETDVSHKPKKVMHIGPQYKDRRLSRVNPPTRPPVVFPGAGPELKLLSCDTEGGRVVMKPLGTSDFIIPRYYRPKAPDLLRAAKDLDELYRVGNSMIYGPYPAMDNREWNTVFSDRTERKLKQTEEAQNKPVKTCRFQIN